MTETTENCVKLNPVGARHVCEPQIYRVPGAVNRGVRDAVRLACQGESPWPLFLYGDAGAGKTCLSLVLLDYYGGFYVTTPQWCERVNDAEFGRLQTSAGYPLSKTEVWREWEKPQLAVLDELGKRSQASDAEYKVVKRCLDSRQGRPAIFVSNLPLEGLERIYDDCIASRLAAGTIVHMTGDRRLGCGA